MIKNKYLVIIAASVILVISIILSVLQIISPQKSKPSYILGFKADSKSSEGSVSISSSETSESSSEKSDSSSLESSSSSSSSSSVDENKFAQAVSSNSGGSGLNVRSTPCGDKIGQPKIWGDSGDILEKPVEKECLGGKYIWWNIKWSDGTSGWSISDNLKFGKEKFELAKGSIEGGIVYPAGKLPNMKICAIKVDSNVETCTETKIPNPKYINNTGYRLELPIGSYYVYGQTIPDAEFSSILKGYYTDSMKCIGETKSFTNCQKTENPKITNAKLAVTVALGVVQDKIVIGDFWAPE